MAATATVNGPNALLQPRMRHGGPNFADGAVVSALSQSLSESYQLFLVPDPCFVVRGHIKGSNTQASGQVIIKLGTSKGDSTFGTYTVSGGAVLAATAFYGPNTLSASGGAQSASNPTFWPVIATVSTAGTTQTTSLSLYVMMEYVLPGNLNSASSQGL